MIILPPKRFQDNRNPIFDPIRHRKWFRKMEWRRVKLPSLQMAYKAWKDGTRCQSDAAVEWGVHERELRDYAAFVEKVPGNGQKPGFLCVLDDSYTKYCQDLAQHHISFYIRKEVGFWGLKERHVVEAFEVDSQFWPSNYPEPWRNQ